jgi:hypothetical protein
MSRLNARCRCRRGLRRLPQEMRCAEGLGLTFTQVPGETAGLSLTLNLWELLEVTTVAIAVDQPQMSRLNARCRCRRGRRRLPQEMCCAEGLGLAFTQVSGETAGLSLALNLWELLEVTTVAMRWISHR